LGFALGYILLYGLLLERLGFLLSTFLLLGLLLGTIESKRWYVMFLMALTGALGTYGIFELWLHTRLPRGHSVFKLMSNLDPERRRRWEDLGRKD